jgi:predicted amidohydrolase
MAGCFGGCTSTAASTQPQHIRIAIIHLAAAPGEVSLNRAWIESAVTAAIGQHSDWIITPELAESGYGFSQHIGLEWIEPFPSTWVRHMAELARANQVVLFLGIPERDAVTGHLYNSVAVIDRQGRILGTYRKHRVIAGRVEGWAQRGTEVPVFQIDGIAVGVLICADAYSSDIAAAAKNRRAQILVSAANWAPLEDTGPKGCWEARSAETGLPLIVNNRTGVEPTIDFTASQSVVVRGGRRLFTFTSPDTKVFLVDWRYPINSFSCVGQIDIRQQGQLCPLSGGSGRGGVASD